MVAILVTGTNQGIGLGVVRELSKKDVDVFATVRDPYSSSADELKEVAAQNPRVHIVKLELNEQSIESAAKEVSKLTNGLDIIINNIGIGQKGFLRPHEVDAQTLREMFEVNAIGPHLVTKGFVPLMSGQKIIVNISTIAGSITYNDGRYPWLVPAYGTSKAALNFLTRDWAKDLKLQGFTVIALYPGWVKTRAAPTGQMTTEESAKGIINVVFNLTPQDNGKFLAVPT